MTAITITKDDTGKVVGVGEKASKAYAAFRKRLLELEPGEVMQIEVWFPRNPKLHGLHFAMLAQLFDMQEQFADMEQMRMWLQVGAGHAEFVPGPTGRMVAIPKSISFRSMDDQDFADHHERVKDFMRSEHARRFLWPHLSEPQTHGMIEDIIEGFER